MMFYNIHSDIKNYDYMILPFIFAHAIPRYEGTHTV